MFAQRMRHGLSYLSPRPLSSLHPYEHPSELETSCTYRRLPPSQKSQGLQNYVQYDLLPGTKFVKKGTLGSK